MKLVKTIVATQIMLASSLSYAGAFDRSSHPYEAILDDGTVFTFAYMDYNPTDREVSYKSKNGVSANLVTVDGPMQDFKTFNYSLKADVNKRVSCMMQNDPSAYGVDSDYEGRIVLGPDKTTISGGELTALCGIGLTPNLDPDSRFKAMVGITRRNFNMSVVQNFNQGNITLGEVLSASGVGVEAPAFLSNLELPTLPNDLAFDLNGSSELAGRLGFAYEKPSMNIRLSFMYTGATTHSMSGTFSDPVINTQTDASASVYLPETYDLILQTGLSEKWRLGGAFGMTRSRWDKLPGFTLDTGSDVLSEIEVNLFDRAIDTKYVSLGKEINSKLAIGGRYMWEGQESGVNGGLSGAVNLRQTFAAGLRYDATDNLQLSPRFAYTKLPSSQHEDQFVEGETSESTTVSYGLDIKYRL